MNLIHKKIHLEIDIKEKSKKKTLRINQGYFLTRQKMKKEHKKC